MFVLVALFIFGASLALRFATDPFLLWTLMCIAGAQRFEAGGGKAKRQSQRQGEGK
jgi:hypothetical protein